MRKLLKSKGIVKTPGQITCKGKRIANGVHLINCCLYIQLADTGKRLHSRHFDFNYDKVIIPNRDPCLKLFRKNKVDVFIPEYGLARRRNPIDPLEKTSPPLTLQKLRQIASKY
jgi:hypothetical protein